MAMQVVDDAAVQQLESSVKGEVLRPGSTGYDEARTIFNAMIDKRPAVIVRVKDPADVIAVVEFARANAAELSIRSGGHGVTGAALTDGGITMDMSAMKRITVDPSARLVRAQAGVTWGELDAATQEHGLAVTGGRVPTTGIAGLTLGSGSGWLERKLGFTCDSLLEADVVTADGRFLRANETENSDLFWALKGGGGNFGAVTQFTYRLHQIGPMIYGGMLMYPGFMAGEVARGYRDYIADAPDEVGGAIAFLTAPPEEFVPEQARGKPAVGIIATYAGDIGDGERVLAPLKQIATPALEMLGPMPYVAAQQLIEAGNPWGNRQYHKANLMDELTDAAIDAVAERAARVPSPFTTLLFQPLGGAVARVPVDATALSRRDAGWAWHILAQWQSAADDELNMGWARELSGALAGESSGGVYINYTSDTDEARSRDAFGPHYDRLVAVKDRYDPGNMFRHGQNIQPSVEAAARAERP